VTRAPISLPGRTVIFDFGEVISLTPSDADRAAIARLAEIGDADAEKFWRAYFRHRDALDRGAGAIAYWQAISDDLGTSWDEARMHELWAADFRSWVLVNPAVIEILSDLRAGGTRMALLSNAGADLASYFRNGPLGDFFEACYVSGELGLIKPQPEIFLHVLADLSITPAEAVFVDNRDSNVAGAEALGITGHVFTAAGALRSFLTSGEGLTALSLGVGEGDLGRAGQNLGRADGGDAAVGPDDNDPGWADRRRARHASRILG
jgi:putative hydrolase of the HAD superfamily